MGSIPIVSTKKAPYLGYKLRQAGVSAIEKTFDSERKRNLDVGEVAAFARCFDVPLAWFFTPPPSMTSLPLATPGPEDPPEGAQANLAELLSIAIGTPSGWDAFVDRIRELLASADYDDTTHKAVYWPLGRGDPAGVRRAARAAPARPTRRPTGRIPSGRLGHAAVDQPEPEPTRWGITDVPCDPAAGHAVVLDDVLRCIRWRGDSHAGLEAWRDGLDPPLPPVVRTPAL